MLLPCGWCNSHLFVKYRLMLLPCVFYIVVDVVTTVADGIATSQHHRTTIVIKLTVAIPSATDHIHNQ